MPLWLRRAFAQREPQIVIPGKAGVPVYINGVDASWGVVVVGEFGLDRPGLVAPTVIYRPLIAEFPTNVPAYRGAGRLCGGRAGDVWRLRCATAAAVFAQPVAPAPNSAGYRGGSWGGAAWNGSWAGAAGAVVAAAVAAAAGAAAVVLPLHRSRRTTKARAQAGLLVLEHDREKWIPVSEKIMLHQMLERQAIQSETIVL